MKLGKELDRETRWNPNFSPADPSMTNPTTDSFEGYEALSAMVEDPDTREAALLFDGLYSLMPQTLGYTFTPSGDPDFRRAFGPSAIIIMAIVLKPLGEALAQLPATQLLGEGGAGRTFGLITNVTVPAAANAARIIVSERLTGLIAKAAQLHALPKALTVFCGVEVSCAVYVAVWALLKHACGASNPVVGIVLSQDFNLTERWRERWLTQ